MSTLTTRNAPARTTPDRMTNPRSKSRAPAITRPATLTIGECKAFVEAVRADVTAGHFETAARTITACALDALRWPCVAPLDVRRDMKDQPGSEAFEKMDERSRRCQLLRLAVDEFRERDAPTMEFCGLVKQVAFEVDCEAHVKRTHLSPSEMASELIAFGRLLDRLSPGERMKPSQWPKRLGAVEAFAVVGSDMALRLDSDLELQQDPGFSHLALYSSVAAAALDVTRSRVEFGAPDTLRIVRVRLEVVGEAEVQPVTRAELAEGDAIASTHDTGRDLATV
ncbi:MAG TPA: hypothetical protein PKC43_06565 [Phycisphaerales bacterium]|nr:hypothetical protein [Phycisphaerales bacterium]HMP37094.1 hypothetical protein [Phycisphaerales bacterium]